MKPVYRISTDSLESALEQIIRVRTAGGKASIKPVFVAELLKELIDRRTEDEELFHEIEEAFGEDLATQTRIVVDEVTSLSQLGTSSFDLEKAEWKLPEEINPPEEEEEELDDSDVTYEVHHRPVLRSKGKHSGMHVRGRWQDGGNTRRAVIYVLLTVIALTFGSLVMAY